MGWKGQQANEQRKKDKEREEKKNEEEVWEKRGSLPLERLCLEVGESCPDQLDPQPLRELDQVWQIFRRIHHRRPELVRKPEVPGQARWQLGP